MTEEEWLVATDPCRMFAWLCRRGKTERHRLGLLFAACCDRIPHSPAKATGNGRPAAHLAEDDDQIALTDAEYHLSGAVLEAMRSIPGGEDKQIVLAVLIRDIFANPFRPVTFDPTWRTENTVGVAAKMYHERDFLGLPILADALQEAGCEDETILSHCRGEGTHVRGCWVVDLVLGKE